MKIKKPEGLFSRTITMHKLYRSLVTVNRNIWIRWIPERLPGLVTNQNHLVLWLIIQHFRGLQKLKCQLHVM